MTFDPDAAAQPGSGIFGLPFSREQSRIVLLPVPFDATTSYGGGAGGGPRAIRNASAQVDLLDHQFGRVYERGIFMEEEDGAIARLSADMRSLAEPIIERGGAMTTDAEIVRRIDDAGERVNAFVYERTLRTLDEKRIPGLVGGDHSTPFGAIRACAERFAPDHGFGVLQIDAHMDLREAFEGFRWSHASITYNAVREIEGIQRVVQVGIRDYGERERSMAHNSGGQIIPHFDLEWSRRMDAGEPFEHLCAEAIAPLPRNVYVTFDIDGLDPALCPGTGTPVPGGPSFNRASVLLEMLARSGRRVVGFDLVEVCPSSGANEWDANVGARVLYKLCGCAMASARG